MNSVVFGCIDIGNSNDLSKTFFNAVEFSDAIVVENQYVWDSFCIKNNILYNKEVLSINLPGLKGNFLNELTEDIQKLFYDNQDYVLSRVKDLYQSNKHVLVLSDEGSSILADSGELIRTYCINNKIPFTVMAGPSAIINSLSMSSIPGSTSPFIFYGPMFSLEYLDEFLDKIDIAPYNFLGVAFLTPKTASHVVLAMLDKIGNVDASLCINITMTDEKVIGKTLKEVSDYLIAMGNEYYMKKEKISLVFRKTDSVH